MGVRVKTYVSVAMVTAEPVLKNGVEYYRVRHPDWRTQMIPKVVFEAQYRPLNDDELRVVKEEIVE